MAKINFTKEHYDKLIVLSTRMLFTNGVVTNKLGTVLNIVELLHTTTINSLNSIRLFLDKEIQSLESLDEWVSPESSQKKLALVKEQRELVNLIIGYKRFIEENETISKEKARLEKELEALKESQKSPEDKIKELENKLKSLDTQEFN